MKANGETIYNTRGNIYPPQDWGVVTVKDKIYYVHILEPSAGGFIFMPGFKGKILSALLKADGRKIKFKQQPEGTFLYLEGVQSDAIDTILTLHLQ